MIVTLLWPVGPLEPGTQIDVAPQLGDVLVREGFARSAADPTALPEPVAPTLPQLQAFAREHGCSMTEARDRIAADLTARRLAGTPTS